MFKQTVATVLTSVGFLSLNISPSMAQTYDSYTTISPSVCQIRLEGQTYNCNDIVMGAFRNGSSNIKLCDIRHCLILILSRGQLERVAQGKSFLVSEVAFQEGSSIVDSWAANMQCNFTQSQSIGCIGKLENRLPIAIYIE